MDQGSVTGAERRDVSMERNIVRRKALSNYFRRPERFKREDFNEKFFGIFVCPISSLDEAGERMRKKGRAEKTEAR
jgi:hypothetical protein